ncbi:MAG: N-acetylmuramoyl-L-alanine amidase [Clostridiales bacterium]|nr:N-acetylmuramoyl-L-alanine amidase [Clostridiales bacterium]
MKKKLNRRDLPMTGILTVVVVLLMLVLALLVTGYRRIYDRGQNAAATSELQTDVEEREDSLGQTDTEKVKLTKAAAIEETETTVETETESETETVIVLGKDESETDTDTDAENDAETDSETETEPETNGYTVAVDPGHQGSWVDMTDKEPVGPGSSEMKAKSTTGTQGSYTGIPEYELNLEISLLLRTELEERGYEVILTREDNDTAISNAERATLAYEEGGDIYVRIHANGSDNSGANGALGMVPSPSNPYVGDLSEESYRLAECILEAYCSTAGFESLGVQYYDNMTGINWSRIPVMILEMGFMTNESDDLRMADPDVQDLMVQGIADGIDAYFEEIES